jgi:hypothetical protein
MSGLVIAMDRVTRDVGHSPVGRFDLRSPLALCIIVLLTWLLIAMISILVAPLPRERTVASRESRYISALFLGIADRLIRFEVRAGHSMIAALGRSRTALRTVIAPIVMRLVPRAIALWSWRRWWRRRRWNWLSVAIRN